MSVTFNFSNVASSVTGTIETFSQLSTLTSTTTTTTTTTTVTTTGPGTMTTQNFNQNQNFNTFQTTFISTRFDGPSPFTFVSTLPAAGLNNNTMTFGLQNAFDYRVKLNANLDQFSAFTAGTQSGFASFTLTFTDGGGLNELIDPQAAINIGAAESAFWVTTAGTTTLAVQDGVQLVGKTVTGIRFFISTGSITLGSLSGTLACFGRGTHIETPEGQVEVQDLRIGDTVTTADGGTRRIKWIGRQSFDTKFGVPAHRRPVRIAQGALGDGLPERDLVLTADHALLIDGLLINAGALVNGSTVTFDTASEMARRFTVFHIETEDHAVILAEGTPSETFIDYTARSQFDNYDQYLALYGTPEEILDMPQPRIASARLVPPAVKARLAQSLAA